MAGTEVVARAHLNEGDYVGALKALKGRSWTDSRELLAGALVLVAGNVAAVLLDLGAFPLLGSSLMLLGILGLLLRQSLLETRTLARHLAQAERGPTTFRFSVDGIVSIDPLTGSNSRWTSLTSVRETRAHYLLVAGQRFQVVPKRAFSGPADEAAFRRLAGLSGLRIDPA